MTEPRQSKEETGTALTMAPAAEPPPLGFVDTVAITAHEAAHWLRHGYPLALVMAALGMVIGFVTNVFMLAVVHDGVSGAPEGGIATAPQNLVSGSLFWLLLPAIVSGLVAYRVEVGRRQFYSDIRGFPGSILTLARRDRTATAQHMLWGFAGGIIAAVALAPTTSGILAVGVLFLVGRMLKPIASAAVASAWRRFVKRVAGEQAKPPSDTALTLGLVGTSLALLGGILLTNPLGKGAVAVLAGATAFAISRRFPLRAVAIPAALAGIAVIFALGHDIGAMACDGGFSACGGTLQDWLSCGLGPVLGHSGLAAVMAAGGSGAGATLGGSRGASKASNPRLPGFAEWRRTHPRSPAWEYHPTDAPPSWWDYLKGQWDQFAPSKSIPRLLDFYKDLYKDMGTDAIDLLKSLAVAGDFYFTPDFMASEATKKARQDLMMNFTGTVGAAGESVLDGLKQTLGDLKTKMEKGDVQGVQAILTKIAADQAMGVALGAAGEAVFGPAVASVKRGLVLPGAADAAAVDAAAAAPHTMQAPTDFPLNAEQQALADRTVSSVGQVLDSEGNPVVSRNQTHKVTYDDGTGSCMKPEAGEKPLNIPGLGSTPKWIREIGQYLVDRALGSTQVPTVAAVDSSVLGRGSVSEWTAYTQVDSISVFSEFDRHMAAVRDYITGNVDRHFGNFGKGVDGGIVAPDGGETFPEVPTHGARSEFVAQTVSKELNPEVLNAVRSIDQAGLRQSLLDSGLSPAQVDGAMGRLNEIATNGRITGEQWTSQGGSMMGGKAPGAPEFAMFNDKVIVQDGTRVVLNP